MHSFLLWFLILGVLCFLMLTPPPTASSSSLAQRRTTGVREARNNALRSPYQSPRQRRLGHADGRSPLRDVGNIHCQNSTAGPSLEQERSGLREAERQRQAALQETPSRRRRRIPGQAQNREPSPTPTTTSQTISRAYERCSTSRAYEPSSATPSVRAPAPLPLAYSDSSTLIDFIIINHQAELDLGMSQAAETQSYNMSPWTYSRAEGARQRIGALSSRVQSVAHTGTRCDKDRGATAVERGMGWMILRRERTRGLSRESFQGDGFEDDCDVNGVVQYSWRGNSPGYDFSRVDDLPIFLESVPTATEG
ncbi:hypothetical protein B0H11DRAFT_1910265 [Mycena galericulata]|nr:hypothetical protein B0H11DRAFT_1910265 [Mycena galericulata]